MCAQVSLSEVCEHPCVSELLPDRQTDKETQNSPSSAGVLHTGNKHTDRPTDRPTNWTDVLIFTLCLSAHLERISVLVSEERSPCPVTMAIHSERQEEGLYVGGQVCQV